MTQSLKNILPNELETSWKYCVGLISKDILILTSASKLCLNCDMDEEQDIYEALPPTTTVYQHMLAGAAAGITEHCIMYPVDCVKVCN